MNDALVWHLRTLANPQEAPHWLRPADSLRSASPCVIRPRDASLGPKGQTKKKQKNKSEKSSEMNIDNDEDVRQADRHSACVPCTEVS